ncbi:MAG: SufD family Fe-S cluster assembly protein, partial [Chlamydiae bacterium]|nr:SufD family Fe-S cluster assembly protein [Chlamydiota bacterium]
HLKQEAKFNFFEINTSAELYRNEINIYLKEKQSDANLYGLNLMTENHEAHFFANVEHLAEETTSFQQIKNISFDRSRTSFEGKIFVDPIAQQTKAYQLNQNLVLSEKAANFSMPNLQILADDVKASHGATFAKIDEEALFYLQSRGVSLKKAKSLLIKSFVNELVDLIQDEELYTELKKQIDEIVDRYL